MKSIFKISLVILLLITFNISAYASIIIDAFDNGIEWQNADYKTMINKSYSNNVDYAYMKSQVDSNNFDVYFLFFLSDSTSASYDNEGFILTLLNDITVTVTSEGVNVEGNTEDYSVHAEMQVNSSDGATCEMRIGIKRGAPENIAGTICYIDGEGNKSYFYPFNLDNPNIEEESTTVKTEKSTAVKTTKEKTTKEKTTKSATKKVTTSKAKTTKAATSKQIEKTTKSKENKTVVYFYEKEIIVSQVYAAEPSQAAVTVETTLYEESTTAPALTSVFEDSPPSKGLKIQKAICAIGGAILIGLGAWAGVSVKKGEKSLKSNSQSDKSAEASDKEKNSSEDSE